MKPVMNTHESSSERAGNIGVVGERSICNGVREVGYFDCDGGGQIVVDGIGTTAPG
jgi:hypothetical protein